VKESGSSDLFTTRRFLPLFLTQFSGALNDNLYKNALLVMIVSATVAGVDNVNAVVNLAADYRRWFALATETIAHYSPAEQQMILHDNAVRFYRLA